MAHRESRTGTQGKAAAAPPTEGQSTPSQRPSRSRVHHSPQIKHVVFKISSFICYHSFCQECRCVLAGYFWLKVSHEVTDKLWTRASVILGLGEACLSSTMCLLVGRRWASRLTHVGLFQNCLTARQPTSLLAKRELSERLREKVQSSITYFWTCSHRFCILLVKSDSLGHVILKGKGLH